jgi:putative NADH-flavin reductase
MNVVVFGASGGVGRHVVPELLGRGHAVTAVVRPGTAYEAPDGARVVRAEVAAGGGLDVVPGHDAIVSCLGVKRAAPLNPWSRLTAPPDFTSATARLISAAAVRHGVRRLLAISAAGVGDSAARMNLVMRFFVATSNVGVAYRDLAVMEQVYADSGLDWHAPRPTRLTDGPRTGAARVVDAFGSFAAISRRDVAAWLVDRLEDGRSEPRAPMIST